MPAIVLVVANTQAVDRVERSNGYEVLVRQLLQCRCVPRALVALLNAKQADCMLYDVSAQGHSLLGLAACWQRDQ